MNIESAKKEAREHRVSVLNRESMEVTGVTDVQSFDEHTVVLCTARGNLSVEGSSLHIHVLSMEQGIVTLDGQIDALTYEDVTPTDAPKSGFFGKIFR